MARCYSAVRIGWNLFFEIHFARKLKKEKFSHPAKTLLLLRLLNAVAVLNQYFSFNGRKKSFHSSEMCFTIRSSTTICSLPTDEHTLHEFYNLKLSKIISDKFHFLKSEEAPLENLHMRAGNHSTSLVK